MTTFPAEQVEAIIQEEMARNDKIREWAPCAHRRLAQLFAEIAVQRPDRERVLGQLSSIFDAQRDIAPYCTEHLSLFVYRDEGTGQLLKVLEAVDNAASITLAASAQQQWPDGLVSREEGKRMLSLVTERIGRMRGVAERAIRDSRPVGLLSMYAFVMGAALEACCWLLMTTDEAQAFIKLYVEAQGMMQDYTTFSIADDTAQEPNGSQT
jgi:hypothetical protein